ncbi:DUF1146 domain-containing protein [Paenibacillus spongiae]|uniref:DUF1146 domain-containing protein n=1 Tax=Paenibacillus spongiae TaxID=2909671 RepID=A0ABY5S8T3_9BACL|nr:DUF1146 domain-containing protein [Paenibacillus spongiae]UVI29933.1 DUF1146 domain-containing protein [Paenibacillus spongiae]
MNLDQLAAEAGMQGLMKIIIELFSITVAWFVIQEVRFDLFLRKPGSPKARILQIMLAVIIGHLFASFLFLYGQWSNALRWLVE